MTRGTSPPVLADQGLGPALEAKARKAPMPVTVSADAVPRLPKEIETAIYFDGKGFDPSTVRRGVGLRSMAERMQALGGALDVRSAPEAGTTIVGRLPIAPTSIRVGEG